jgi:long-subunit fatty acid transport protein
VAVLVTITAFVVGMAAVADAAGFNHATPFLRTGVSARAIGMGNAFVAAADDASAGFFNPAGITRIEKWGFSSMLSADMAIDRQMNYLAVAGSFDWGSLGLSWVNAGITDVGLKNGTTEDYMDNYFLLSYGNMANGFRWGANFVIANNSVAEETGVGGDLGFQWDFHKEARLGLVAQSLGLKVGEDQTPFNIRLGIVVMPDILEGFTFPIEIQKTQNLDEIKFRIGGEFAHSFDGSDYGTAIRAGVDDGAFTLGGGLRFKQFGVDYAYVTEAVDVFGENHRFSLTGNF